jgi:hypothetical protein
VALLSSMAFSMTQGVPAHGGPGLWRMLSRCLRVSKALSGREAGEPGTADAGETGGGRPTGRARAVRGAAGGGLARGRRRGVGDPRLGLWHVPAGHSTMWAR